MAYSIVEEILRGKYAGSPSGCTVFDPGEPDRPIKSFSMDTGTECVKDNKPEYHRRTQKGIRQVPGLLCFLRFSAAPLEEGTEGIGAAPADEKLHIRGSKDPECCEEHEIDGMGEQPVLGE
jgi:hypothetical protein